MTSEGIGRELLLTERAVQDTCVIFPCDNRLLKLFSLGFSPGDRPKQPAIVGTWLRRRICQKLCELRETLFQTRHFHESFINRLTAESFEVRGEILLKTCCFLGYSENFIAATEIIELTMPFIVAIS